ncbi:hypothetical protein C8R45DRAFT_941293 [Mycena sanguinolenta]|nr:hypothetical protein C8R45DRAFT_941293 [Mycena sanguinolenta]
MEAVDFCASLSTSGSISHHDGGLDEVCVARADGFGFLGAPSFILLCSILKKSPTAPRDEVVLPPATSCVSTSAVRSESCSSSSLYLCEIYISRIPVYLPEQTFATQRSVMEVLVKSRAQPSRHGTIWALTVTNRFRIDVRITERESLTLTSSIDSSQLASGLTSLMFKDQSDRHLRLLASRTATFRIGSKSLRLASTVCLGCRDRRVFGQRFRHITSISDIEIAAPRGL